MLFACEPSYLIQSAHKYHTLGLEVIYAKKVTLEFHENLHQAAKTFHISLQDLLYCTSLERPRPPKGHTYCQLMRLVGLLG